MGNAGLGWAADIEQEETGQEATCDHTFQPDEWRAEHEIPPAGDGPQECSEPPLDHSAKCRFHASSQELEWDGLDEDEVFAEYVTEYNGILDANFNEIHLGNIDIEGREVKLLSPQISKIRGGDGVFTGDIEFKNAAIDSINICDFESNGRINFHTCKIKSSINISGSSFDGCLDFEGSKIDHWTYIFDTEFRENVGLSEVQSLSDIVAHRCRFLGGIDANPISRIGSFVLTDCEISEMDCQIFDLEDTLVQLKDSEIRSGNMRGTGTEDLPRYKPDPDSGPDVLYDLSGARLGDVELHTAEKGLENYYFESTDLDNFNLRRHADALKEANWNLHEFSSKFREYNDLELLSGGGVGHIDEYPSSNRYQTTARIRDFESTYINATRAAELQGDYISASKFFTRASRARKLINRRQIAQPNPRHGRSRLIHAVRYAKAVFLQYTCNYGESPLRTFGWAFLMLTFTTLYYPYSGGVKRASQEIIYGRANSTLTEVLGDSLYFSISTFTTLGYGDFSPITLHTKLIAGGEALAGSVLIALFIFTLSKSMKR
ncbi:potassium channel family protein [Haloglomus salinum]|uniref:potassium channel family protein n=1 Tax=Haloglomus salinum TaxID=2962673 RepID=UPI0020C9BD12|nr:potassium channel family protein [Haloglomus salinum]